MVSLDVEVGVESKNGLAQWERQLSSEGSSRRFAETVAKEEHAVWLHVHHAGVRAVVTADVSNVDSCTAEVDVESLVENDVSWCDIHDPG